MKLLLTRTKKTPNAIFGKLYINNTFLCYTLENSSLAIQTGSFDVILYKSQKWGYAVPLLLNIPGRSWIEIHIGNTKADTEGCILVGQSMSDDAITESHQAFEDLLTKLTFPAVITISESR